MQKVIDRDFLVRNKLLSWSSYKHPKALTLQTQLLIKQY